MSEKVYMVAKAPAFNVLAGRIVGTNMELCIDNYSEDFLGRRILVERGHGQRAGAGIVLEISPPTENDPEGTACKILVRPERDEPRGW